MITIALAEDHHLVREGLKQLLLNDKTLKLVGEAKDGMEAIKIVEEQRPDILLLDLMIPRMHGLEVIRQVRRDGGPTKVLVVSMHSDEPYVLEAFRNGAAGYVLKDASPSELLQAVRTVASGNRYVSPQVSDLAITAFLKKLNGADIYSTLSGRERVVLQLAAEGHNTAEIAKELFISPRTVETHRANLMKKLALRSQTDLVRFAIRKKIIQA